MGISEHGKTAPITDTRRMPKRKTKPWVGVEVIETWFFRKDDDAEDFRDYSQRFRMGSLLDQVLCCIAYLQKRVGNVTFSQVLAGFRYQQWDAKPQKVQDAVYALASARQGSLFHMKLDEGRTLVLRREVLSYLDSLKYCSPSRLLKERFADQE